VGEEIRNSKLFWDTTPCSTLLWPRRWRQHTPTKPPPIDMSHSKRKYFLPRAVVEAVLSYCRGFDSLAALQ